jgi:hypothetical protein
LADLEELLQAAQKVILDSYGKEFDQLAATFRDLDAKAQGTAATAGVFLAATLAYLNRPNPLGSTLAKTLMTFAVFGLIWSIMFSLRALAIRLTAEQPSGDEVRDLIRVITRVPGDDEEQLHSRLLCVYGDAAILWEKCVRERRETNEEKALDVWSAQKSLTLTAFAISFLIMSLIMNG